MPRCHSLQVIGLDEATYQLYFTMILETYPALAVSPLASDGTLGAEPEEKGLIAREREGTAMVRTSSCR